MNLHSTDSENSSAPSCCATLVRNSAYVAAVVGALLVVGALTWIMVDQTTPAPLGKAREAERLQNLKELRAAMADQLTSYGYADQAKGLIRIPVSKAMDLTLQEFKDPAKGRAALIERIEKVTKPVSYE